MFQENECVTLLIGIGLFIFIIFNYSKLKNVSLINHLLNIFYIDFVT